MACSRKVDFVGRVSVAAMRHVNDGPEHLWRRNVGRRFEEFALCVKDECLARLVGSDRLDCDGRVSGHGTRLLVLVMKKESEARRHIGFNDGDFNKAMAEVHEAAIMWSTFAVPTVLRAGANHMRMAVAFAINVSTQMIEAERHQCPTRDPWQPAANRAAPFDADPHDHAVTSDQQDKAEAGQYCPVESFHGHGLCLVVVCFCRQSHGISSSKVFAFWL